MAQDPSFELLQRTSRLESELVHEHPPRFGVGPERFGLPARAVEGEHLESTRAFTQGLFADERLELAERVGVSAELNSRFEATFTSRQLQLLETSELCRGERFRGELPEGVTAKERERVGKQAIRLLEPTVAERGRAAGEQIEKSMEIELTFVDADRVTRAVGHESIPAERATQRMDVHLQCVRCCLRRLFAPERVDQAIAGERLVCMQQQVREQGARLAARELELLGATRDPERAEDSEFERMRQVGDPPVSGA